MRILKVSDTFHCHLVKLEKEHGANGDQDNLKIKTTCGQHAATTNDLVKLSLLYRPVSSANETSSELNYKIQKCFYYRV